MAYSPLNTNVFIAALAGALAGIAVAGRQISDTTAADYAPQVNAAGAFAQAFDTAWGVTAPSTLAIQCIQEESEAVWADRSPASTTPAFYTPLCNAMIATITQATVYAAAQGVPIPQAGGIATFVWQPGGVAGNGKYNTWASVAAAVAKVNGSRRIYVDTSLGAAVISGDVAFDLSPAANGIFGDVELYGTGNSATAGAAISITGATSVKGLTSLSTVTLTNASSLATGAIVFPAGGGCFYLNNGSFLRQDVTAGGPAIICAAGQVILINLSGISAVLTVNGGANAFGQSGGVIVFQSYDASTVFANMVTRAAGTMLVTLGTDGAWGSQASAATINVTANTKGGMQTGVATISVAGATVLIPANITSGARIDFGLKTPANDANTVKYAALDTDRVVGSIAAGGGFKLSALTAAGGGALNVADTSVLDWRVTN